MRIALIHNFYRSENPSGENEAVKAQAAALGARGHHVDLYTRASDEIAAYGLYRKARMAVHVVWNVEAERTFRLWVAEVRPDVIHVHNTFPLLSPSILRSAAASSAAVISTLHNFRLICANGLLLRGNTACTSCITKGPLQGLRHGCYRSRTATLPLTVSIAVHKRTRTWDRYVDQFACPSAYSRAVLGAAGIPIEKISVIPNFVAAEPVQAAPRREGFLFVGRLSTEKGIAGLLENWRPQFGTLKIIGDGPLRALVQARATKDPSVEYVGPLPRQQARQAMVRAKAVIIPSICFENCPTVLVEAYAAGTPVIAPRLGSFPEAIQNDGTGYLLQDGIRSLGESIKRLDSPETVARLSAGALRTYQGRFSIDSVSSQIEALYERALSQKARTVSP